jgi:anti-sigma B factor antagonist
MSGIAAEKQGSSWETPARWPGLIPCQFGSDELARSRLFHGKPPPERLPSSFATFGGTTGASLRFPAGSPECRAPGRRGPTATGFLPASPEHRMATHRRIDVSKVGDITVVKFLDKKILDEAGILELGAELFGLVELENRKSVLLNFTDVEFLSSAALGKLITLDRKVKSHKGRMKLSNIRPEILEVFKITKLDKVFDIRKDEAEAISAF